MKRVNSRKKLPSSFRDVSGFIYLDGGRLLRQINITYQRQYDHLMRSGLYKELSRKNLIVKHAERNRTGMVNKSLSYKIIEPTHIPLISYPFEWTFSMMKSAAHTTLEVLKISLNYGMTLKDASGYNIQFVNGNPILIDTLSFDFYKNGEPWIAYKQFCEHFLAPLVLSSRVDPNLTQLLKDNLDGIPLSITSRLLPLKSYFSLPILIHIHFHSRNLKKYTNRPTYGKYKITKRAILGLIDNLMNFIYRLELDSVETEWSDYYDSTNYDKTSSDHKKKILENFLGLIKPKSVLDVGANTGVFSRIAGKRGIFVVSTDSDAKAVEKGFIITRKNRLKNIEHLVLDITNPSPGVGWNNLERENFFDRFRPECILALAFIHHLTISDNLPFEMSASFFSSKAKWLIIEFVGRDDSNVEFLLERKGLVSHPYSQQEFEKVYGLYYKTIKKIKIKGSERTMYLYERN
jgi:SAM-dependent methyltransferase